MLAVAVGAVAALRRGTGGPFDGGGAAGGEKGKGRGSRYQESAGSQADLHRWMVQHRSYWSLWVIPTISVIARFDPLGLAAHVAVLRGRP